MGILNLVFIGLYLILMCNASDMNFGRSQVCIEQGPKFCNKWNITVELSYYSSFIYYMCFPENTRVMTETGPQFIRNISVGDRILGYNFQTGKPVYALVTAWLHRDTEVQAEFNIIKTKNGETYLSSNGHNIAYNNEGVIGFKYADQLQNGDELITLNSSSNLTVKSSKGLKFQFGMYSPMTQTSNFYIYPSNISQINQQFMILVHCLAQIENPHKNQHWVHNLLSVTGWFGINQHKNLIHESYFHPITHLMKFAKDEHRKIKILLAHGDGNEIKYLQAQQTGWNRGFHDYTHEYSSTSYYSGQQQRENRKIQLVGVFACLMQLNSLITSY